MQHRAENLSCSVIGGARPRRQAYRQALCRDSK
jgi:hypothetical protein